MLERIARRLSRLLRLQSAEHDLREELAHHRAMVLAAFEQKGLSPRDAADAARRTMGNETYMREEARGVWLWPGLEAITQDFRYALRGLRRSPAFATVAVLSLALGIGANTAIFGLIHGLLLARLPVGTPTELVELQRDFGAKGTDDRLSRAEFDALEQGSMPLAMFSSGNASMDVDGVTVNIGLDAVDGRYFAVLGLRAQRGRLISEADDADAAQIAVVSDRFWRGRLNGDPAILGRIVKIGTQPFTIVGVTPPRFAGLRFPAFDDVEIPYRAATTLGVLRGGDSHSPSITVVGRRSGVRSIEEARDGLRVLWNRCCASGDLVTLPKSLASAPTQLNLVDVSRGIPQAKLNVREQFSKILFVLMGGVAILLLAACANVANLLLARGSARSGELAVRVALGASRSRLVMQLMIESLLLSLLGAFVGWLLARWGTAMLSHMDIGYLSSIVEPPDGNGILFFTTAVGIASGILFGLLPAIRVVRGDLISSIKHGAKPIVNRRRSILGRGLVAVQVALALLLVSGAAMLVETLRNLEKTDAGFDPVGRFAVTAETRRTSYEKQLMTAVMATEMLSRVRAIPGVQSAGFGSLVPVYGGRGTSDIVTVRGADPLPTDDATTGFVGVTPGYFASLGMRLVAGRDIDSPVAQIPSAAARNVVVNERFVKQFFANRDPIGQTFQDHDDGDTTYTENRIVGVVADAKYRTLRAPPTPMYFTQVIDHQWPFLVLVVRPVRGGQSIGVDVSRALRQVAPGISVGEPTMLSSSIDDALIRERMAAALASLFGTIALSLVAVGLYGVMLYQVTERTTEFGIRMALGAQGTSVVGLVLRQSLGIVVAGVVVGTPLAIFAGRAVASQLYGVSPYDPSALTIAAVSLVFVAIVASLVPVRRAVSVDPIRALRAD